MKAKLLKALAKVPVTMKAELKQQAALIPLKAQLHMEQKLKQSLTASMNEYKDIPGQLIHEFKRQSFHQGQQPFQDNNNYFEQYHYRPQQQRYNSSPEPNLAEILHIKEQDTRRYK